MEWLIILLTVLGSLATIAGLLYIALIGQKSISEWRRERGRGARVEQDQALTEPKDLSTTGTPTLGSEAVIRRSAPTSGEQMLAVMKAACSPGLDLTTIRVPAIGPRDILVRVSAASICGTDLGIYEWNRWAQARVQPPIVLGHEFCGVVVDRGKEVTEVTIGDLVAAESHVTCGQCSYCQSGHSNVCPNTQTIGIERDGAFAEYVAIPAVNAWKLPSDIPVQIAAIMEPFGNSVHAALSQDLANRNVLITGCGPIGLMAIAVAKWAGARIICASDISDFRLNLASQMGASVLLNAHTAIQDLGKVVTEATSGQGIDVFLEMSGATSALTFGLNVLRNAGKAVFMGIHSEPVQIDVDSLITLKGITIYGAAGRRSDQTWERMRNVLASGGINLSRLITHEFPLDQIDKAFALMQSREAGKVILRPSRTSTSSVPMHFAPSSSMQASTNTSWHDFYGRQAREFIADSKVRELLLLKGELDSLFAAAQELQQAIYGYRRQLLDPKLTTKQKAKLKVQLGELETELEQIRNRSQEVRQEIESAPSV